MKKTVYFALATAMVLTLAGCQKEEKQVIDVSKTVGESSEETAAEAEKTVDAAALASSLLGEISYDDTLTEVTLDTAKMFLNIADVEIEESYIYESSGATAEEIVVLKCKDSDGAANAKKAFEERVSEQTDNFTDYVPEEVPKLKDAVIITSKEYAVLSVSGDSSKAKDIIEGAFK